MQGLGKVEQLWAHGLRAKPRPHQSFKILAFAQVSRARAIIPQCSGWPFVETGCWASAEHLTQHRNEEHPRS